MENSASQTKAEAVRELKVGAKQENLEFLVTLPEENISKILSASASVVVEKYEALLGELSFNGQACINIVYMLEDGNVSNYKVCQDFSGKFENLSFDPSSIVKILPNVLDISIENANGNSIKVKITLENTYTIIKNQEIALLTSEDENIYVKQAETKLFEHKKRNCVGFEQSSVFETKFPVNRILNTTSCSIIKKVTPLDGIVVFEGDIITKILYSTQEERPVLVSLFNKDSFREEVEDESINKDSIVMANSFVVGRDMDENIDAENKTVEVTVPVKICYDVFNGESAVIAVDAYSTQNELNLTTEAFLSNEIVGMETFDSKIDGSISLDEQALRIDKILAVDGAYLTKNETVFENGEVQTKGIVHLNIIYLNDEQEKVDSVSIEIPYNYNEKLATEGTSIETVDNVIEIDAVVKRGRDVYVDGKIRTQAYILKEVENAVVSSAEIGKAIPERDGGLEIYFASEGKTFWDVAKDLKVDEEVLKQQNSEIVEPFEKDEKIIYFEQVNIDVE